MNTLYGSDADAKAKAKASSGSSGIASNPGVETVTNGSSHTALSTLYGSDADAKIKAKASSGNSEINRNPGFSSVRALSNAAASEGRTNNAIDTLYGSNADSKVKARSAIGGSTVAANPGVESVGRLPAFLAENDESDTKEPVAKRVSMGSTDSESGSISSPQYKSTSRRGNQSEVASIESLHIPTGPKTPSSTHGGDKKTRGDDEEAKKSKKKRAALILFLLLLLLIGAGIAVWLLLFKKDSNFQESPISSSNLRDPTTAPSSTTISSTAPSGIVGQIFSTSPTTTPFIEGLLFQPPSKSNCDTIARNETIAGREELEDVDFGLGLDVVLSGDSTMTESLVSQLLDAIQEKILPSLAGCNILVDEVVEDWRFVIFDAFVFGNVEAGERCKDDNLAIQNCHLIMVQLDLFLKGRVRFLHIIDLISDEEENISNFLGLPDPFLIVKLNQQIDILTPTPSPTITPSGVPSSTPSDIPTVKDSTNPTSLPTGTPTKTLSGVPTRSPSLIPSLAPSAVPTTALPTTYSSSVPTNLPSGSPSTGPSQIPSAVPSFVPSKTPSSTPTESPSASPSLRPSNTPSERPTAVPSGSPSRTPSAMPSTSAPTPKPSAYPSTSPTAIPSVSPSLGIYYWVTCGGARNGDCSPRAASQQNVNFQTMDGIPSTNREDEIAVRCCSDDLRPGFSKPLSIEPCPYAASSFGGACYNTTSYYDANSICTTVGARLCTLGEVQYGCTQDTGCWHNHRMAWTSTTGLIDIYYWVTCGARNGECSGRAASRQNVIFQTMDGIPSTNREDEIAVRCCSDDLRPGFSKPLNIESCPYAASSFGGACYNTTSYYEANSICTTAGARLCTLEEVQDGCTENTGCWHNHRMAWTSTPGP